MICSGKIFCDIYRDKKYCRKDSRASDFKQCNCSHAVFECEVGACIMKVKQNECPYFHFEEFDLGRLLNETK